MFERTINREGFKEQFRLWENRKVTIGEAMEILGIKSRGSWYRIARELELIK